MPDKKPSTILMEVRSDHDGPELRPRSPSQPRRRAFLDSAYKDSAYKYVKRLTHKSGQSCSQSLIRHSGDGMEISCWTSREATDQKGAI
jgi:hypothetical protein